MTLSLDSFESGYDAGKKDAMKDAVSLVKAEVEKITFSKLNEQRVAGREIGLRLGALYERKRIIGIIENIRCEGGDLDLLLAVLERKDGEN